MRRVAVSAELHPLRRKVTSHELLTWSIAEWPSDCSAMDAVNPHRLLVRIVRGDVANVAFDDLAGLLLRLGFMLRRTTGSHHIYVHQEVPQAVNIQPPPQNLWVT